MQVGDFPYTVVGVMQHKEQDSQLRRPRHLEGVRALRDDPARLPEQAAGDAATRSTGCWRQPRSIAQHDACKRAGARRRWRRRHDFDPRDEEAAGIWDTVEESQAFRKMTDGMKYFLGAVGLATLLIGGIGVMNVMLVAVRERTREIGVRKAVGATRRSIVRQFFAETMIVVFLSGGAGPGRAPTGCAPS